MRSNAGYFPKSFYPDMGGWVKKSLDKCADVMYGRSLEEDMFVLCTVHCSTE